jgi:arylsulfatase A
MTGRHYLRTGVYNTRFGGDTLAADETTLAEVLKKGGYRTGIFGKWHLGTYARYMPHRRGFDDALTFPQGHLERLYYPNQLQYNGTAIDARGYVTDILTDAAIDFVQRNRSRPFFLYLPYNVPHEPHIVDDAHFERNLKKGLPIREARIYGMVTQCDANIGRLLGALDANGLRDDTIVLFLSDNGGVSRHFKAGLRGNKGSPYEGGVRVPFFARWPGRFPAGAKTDAMACATDVFPTLCELAGCSVPPAVDGKSVASLLRSGKGRSPHEFVYHIWDRFRPSLESGWSISDGRLKLVRGRELFDLTADPGETRNIATERPADVARLRTKFQAWFDDVTKGRKFEPVPIEVGRGDENPVEIQASWARFQGTHSNQVHPYSHATVLPEPLPGSPSGRGPNYTFAGYDWDTIDNWRAPGTAASWVLQVVATGQYEISVAYGCDAKSAGGRFRLSLQDARIDAVVEPTPGREVFVRRILGTAALREGSATLTVTARTIPGGDLMALNRIWIRRLTSTRTRTAAREPRAGGSAPDRPRP